MPAPSRRRLPPPPPSPFSPPCTPSTPPRSTASDGSTFWFVLDETIADSVPCPPVLTTSFGFGVQRVLPGENPACGLTASCATPPKRPKKPTGSPKQATLDGGACEIDGAFAPCAYECGYGQVPVPDQGGTCPPGAFCCVSTPTCARGTTLCTNQCVNLLTDVNNCGRCGNDCTGGVPNAATSCQKGVCTCNADGISHPFNQIKEVAYAVLPVGGVPCQYQTRVSLLKGARAAVVNRGLSR